MTAQGPDKVVPLARAHANHPNRARWPIAAGPVDLGLNGMQPPDEWRAGVVVDAMPVQPVTLHHAGASALSARHEVTLLLVRNQEALEGLPVPRLQVVAVFLHLRAGVAV